MKKEHQSKYFYKIISDDGNILYECKCCGEQRVLWNKNERISHIGRCLNKTSKDKLLSIEQEYNDRFPYIKINNTDYQCKGCGFISHKGKAGIGCHCYQCESIIGKELKEIQTFKNVNNGRKTKMERYGNPNYNNKEKIKASILNTLSKNKEEIVNKRKQTKQEKYNDPNYNNINKNLKTREKNSGSVKKSYQKQFEKSKETMLKNRGFLWNPEKTKQTALLKSNGKYSWFTQFTENKQKISDTWRKKSQKELDIKKEKEKKTKLEHYGDPNFCNPQKTKQTKLKRYNNPNYNNIEKNKQTKLDHWGNPNYNNVGKAKQTCLNKFGVEHYTQSILYHKTGGTKKYLYKEIFFDSSYELAFYLEHENENILRCPIKYKYYYDNKKHYCIPDFILNGEIIEIKGDYFLDSNTGKWINPYAKKNKSSANDLMETKHQCLLQNNVKIIYTSSIKDLIKKYKNTIYQAKQDKKEV